MTQFMYRVGLKSGDLSDYITLDEAMNKVLKFAGEDAIEFAEYCDDQLHTVPLYSCVRSFSIFFDAELIDEDNSKYDAFFICNEFGTTQTRKVEFSKAGLQRLLCVSAVH